MRKKPTHCQNPTCGIEYPHLQRDRIIPGIRGGRYTKDNIQWLCPNCHVIKTMSEITPEQRKEFSRLGNTAANALLTSEQRRESIAAARAFITREQLSKNGYKATTAINAGLTPEQRKEKARKGAFVTNAILTSQQRSDLGRIGAIAINAIRNRDHFSIDDLPAPRKVD